MAETFDFVKQENIALMAGQLGEGAFKRQPQRGMSDRRTWLRARRGIIALLLVVRGDFFLPQPAASRVVAGVHQDAEGPGHKTRLAPKTGDAALNLQESLLHSVFRVRGAAKDVTGKILHARPMECIQSLVRAQVSRPAGRRQRCILRPPCLRRVRSGDLSTERFHPPLPLRYGGDSSLPSQRKSHNSHAMLLGYRRRRGAKGQGLQVAEGSAV